MSEFKAMQIDHGDWKSRATPAGTSTEEIE